MLFNASHVTNTFLDFSKLHELCWVQGLRPMFCMSDPDLL